MARTLFTGVDAGDMKVEVARQDLQNLLSGSPIAFMNQSHSDQVVVVENADRMPDADALVTTTKGLSLAVLTADCLPILLASDVAVAAVHAGRIGVGNGIIEKTILQMQELGARDIAATIGPAICSECYEVAPTMYADFVSQVPASATNSDRHCLDLRSGAIAQLAAYGVSAVVRDICTKESVEYFSYRRDATTKRQVSVVTL